MEAESADTHVAFYHQRDSIEIWAPKGFTLWYNKPLQAPLTIQYEAMVILKDSTDRLSDLNCFWMATDPSAFEGNPIHSIPTRNGIFTQCQSMHLYYMGYGGNWNSTTRFRRYDGSPSPAILTEYTDSAHLLRPNHWYSIRLNVTSQGHVTYEIDGQCIVNYQDPHPLTHGWFGFRTTLSHTMLRHFRVL